MNNEMKGTIFAIAAAVISGLSIPLNKVFVVSIDPIIFTSIRSLLIGVVFLVITRLRHERVGKMNVKYMALIAVIGGAFAFLLFFDGLKLTTAGRAAFLQKTMPLYIAVLAFAFLKERISRKQLLSLGLMIIGTVIIFYSDIVPTLLWSNPSLGDLLVIGATILWAIENVVAKKVMLKNASNFMVSFVRMFFGGVILFSVALLLGRYSVLISLTSQQALNIGVSTAILFGYVLFWYWSIRYINVSKASILLLLAPVISFLIGFGYLSEPAPYSQIIGSAIILIGAYLVSNIKSEFRSV
jgi:drug/metabolite transporter (DMT)-like permease